MTDDNRIHELEEQLSECDKTPIVDIHSKIDIMNDLAWEMSDTDPAQAQSHAEKAHTLANSIGNGTEPYQLGIAYSLRTLGYLNQRLRDYPRGLTQLLAAQEIFESLNHPDGISVAQSIDAKSELSKGHLLLSEIYQEQGDLSQALFHFKEYHSIKESIFNDKADQRLQVLKVANDTETSRKKAEVLQLRTVELTQEISEREPVKEQLRKLRRAVEQSGSTILITDLDGTIEFANPAFSKITGYSLREAVGQNPRMVKSGETPSQVYEELWETIGQGEVWEGEFLNKKKNGELYWEYATISPVKNREGQITHYVAVKDDITKRKQDQESLKRQNRYQKALAWCSQELLRVPGSEGGKIEILNQVLSHLVATADVGRAYICNNFHDPQDGDCLGIVAEACAPGVPPCITNLANRKVSWSAISLEVRSSLKAGKSIGGPIEQVFASIPTRVEKFKSQHPPLLSVQFVPTHFGDHWWGFIGFDDVVTARQWGQEEILLLQTASEMIGSTLQRWEVEAELQASHDRLEERVLERTAELNETVGLLRQEVTERQKAEAEIRERLVLDQALAAISTRLMQATDIQNAIDETLAVTGDITRTQRIILFRFQEGDQRIKKTLEWCAAGVEPVLDEVRNFRVERVQWLVDRLRQEGSFYMEDISVLPSDVQESLAVFAQGSSGPHYALPVYAGEDLVGFLVSQGTARALPGFEQNLQVLEVVVGMLGSLWQRERVLETLEERVAARTQELSTFFDLTMLVSGSSSLDEILTTAVSRIISACRCDLLCVHLYSENGKKMELAAHYNLPEKRHESLRVVLLPEDHTYLAAELGEALVTTNLEQMTDLPPALRLPGFQTFLSAQIRTRDQVHGGLSCYRRSDEGFALDEISLLVALAEQLGIVVENHRLRLLTEEMAVLKERQRLARELHDSITQSLYSQSLIARTSRYAYEDGEDLKLLDSLNQLEEGALFTLKEMRLLLFQLQTQALEDIGLVMAIDERMDMVERRLGIKAKCHIDESVFLSQGIKEAFYRITLEALNNSLKHASAAEVRVGLEADESNLVLEIMDDGKGFDKAGVRGGMGINNMTWRVNELGGVLEIDTTQGGGTIVRVTVANEDAKRK